MSNHKVLGIIGGGQLGSMLCQAASKINIKTKIYCDDKDAPAQNYSDQFICGSYDDENKHLKLKQKMRVYIGRIFYVLFTHILQFINDDPLNAHARKSQPLKLQF